MSFRKLIECLILLLCCGLLAVDRIAAQAINREDDIDLRGPVRSVEVSVETVTHGSGEKTRNHTTVEYDLRGRVTASAMYEDTRLRNSAIYRYNRDGRLQEMTTFYLNGQRDEKTIYKHSKTGNIIEIFAAVEGRHRLSHSERYEKGRLVEEISYSLSGFGVPSLRTLHFYNTSGLESQSKYYVGRKLTHSRTMFYDRGNRIVRREQRDANGSLTMKTMYEYGENGVLSQRTSYGRRDTVSSIDHFDKSGNIVRELIYDPDGRLFRQKTYDYEFDDRGNWIASTAKDFGTDGNGNLAEVFLTKTRRKILYY